MLHTYATVTNMFILMFSLKTIISAANKAVLKGAEKSIIAAHHIYEDEIIYELEIIYLFLFVLQLEHLFEMFLRPACHGLSG